MFSPSPLARILRLPRLTSRHTPIAGGVPSSIFALVVTILVWLAMTLTVLAEAIRTGVWGQPGTAIPVLAYMIVSTILGMATAMHLVARLGAARRFSTHSTPSGDDVRDSIHGAQRTVTVLVPSYREETQVIRRTMLSAALLEYPGLRIVLLIDDPPGPIDGSEEESLLQQARKVPDEVAAQVGAVHHLVAHAEAVFLSGRPAGRVSALESVRLHVALTAASHRLRAWAEDWARGDHGDRLFATAVLGRLADEFEGAATALALGEGSDHGIPVGTAIGLYRRLVATFDATTTSFERKQFANLSHEPNKAMNLNAYLALMGRTVRLVNTPRGLELADSAEGSGWHVPNSDYVLTLDADSILLPDYAMRLVHLMERPEHKRVAVAQTPYSAFPGPVSLLERVAGATTDVQYLLHQGMTHFGATFWVGANAVLRKCALDEIAIREREGEDEVVRYIQDRTVIEDTESSIDLLLHGWSLINYPERLAYSATPPDFGSLIIQRRRWANGGLIILPRMRELLRSRRRRGVRCAFAGVLLQLHYLISMPVVATGLLVLLLLPARTLEPLMIPWLIPLAATPYLAVYAADLRRNGYRAFDMVRVYALNMLLVAVNLAGGLRSLQQILTNRKAPFLRTPKISDRVAAPPVFVLVPLMLGLVGLGLALASLAKGPSLMAVLAGLAPLLTLYGLGRLVGFGSAVEDVGAGLAARVRRRQACRR